MISNFLARLFSSNNALVSSEEISSLSVHLPENDISDELEMLSCNETDLDIGYAEGQTFGIEYLNAKGEMSQRRVTVRNIKMGKSCPLLQAYCHSSEKFKAFRVDRVQSVFDCDGEIFEVGDFLYENLGIPKSYLEDENVKAIAPLDKFVAEKPMLTLVTKDSAALLVALAMCDGYMCENERDLIVRYLVNLIERNQGFLDAHGVNYIQKYVNRLRPSEDCVLRELENVYSIDPIEKNKFLQACSDVVKIDGTVTPSEQDMLADFSCELTGVTLLAQIRDYRDVTTNLECSFQ